MTRIGIISDTHGYWDPRYAEHFAGCGEIWHAGDIGDYSIVERLAEVAPVVRAVSGNCDFGETRRKCPETLEFSVEGVNVWLTHVGGYPGRYAPGMKKLLVEKHIGLMVCGHSHILKVMPDPGLHMLHINPGAAGQQGWHSVRTLVRLVIDKGLPSDLEVIELAAGRRGM